MRCMLFLFILCPLFAWTPEPNPDAFAMPVNQWTKVAEAPADPYGRELEPGQGAFLCYFPDSNLFYRYGGYTPTENNDLYSFNLAQRKWVLEKSPDYSWPPPSDRPGAGPWWSMAYDGKRKVIWMMGGSGSAKMSNPGLYNDIWKFDPATGVFTKMNSTGYYYSEQVRIVYDSINDMIIRAPARDDEWAVIENRNVTRAYNPVTNAWEVRHTPGSPVNALAAVWVYAQAYGKCVYMSADTTGDSLGCVKAVTWTFSWEDSAWTRLNSTLNPPMRVAAAASWNPVDRLVMVHGGVGRDLAVWTGYASRGCGVVLQDTWVLDLATGQWTPLLNVGKPSIPTLRNTDNNPLLPQSTVNGGRMVFTPAASFDPVNGVFVVSSPCYGVWALRYQPGAALPALNLPALPALPAVSSPEQVYPTAPLNQRLLDMAENTWLKLDARSMGGGEIPLVFDPASGYLVKYGGCNNFGTTFASGYGNNLIAFDPATEHWMALRPVDPCGPPRPGNGCTRFYGADATGGCVWFAGGTAGNYLAASLPPGWGSGSGTWRYVWKKDAFELVPNTVAGSTGAGVTCAFDPVNRLFITVPCCYNSDNNLYNAATSAWSTGGSKTYPATGSTNYKYADFVDSLGVMAVLDDDTLRAYDPVAKTWSVLSVAPASHTDRPVVAYDCYNNVLMVWGINGKTYIYDIRNDTWQDMAPDTVPGVSEELAFDRRHGVFIGTNNGDYTYAYKFRNVPGLKKELAVKAAAAPALSVAPNPFTGSTTIRYDLDRTSVIRLAVYDLSGRLVTRLLDEKAGKGAHSAVWKGDAAAGLYLIRLETGNRTLTRPVLLVK